MNKENQQQKHGKMTSVELTFANDIVSHPIMFGIAAIMRDYKANQKIQSVHQSKKSSQADLSRFPLAKQLSFHFLTSYSTDAMHA
jgi:hypothetical protein